MIVAYIFIAAIAFLATMYFVMYIAFFIIMFVVFSIDAASNGKFMSPEIKSEFQDIRKKFSIKHFLRLITFIKQ